MLRLALARETMVESLELGFYEQALDWLLVAWHVFGKYGGIVVPGGVSLAPAFST